MKTVFQARPFSTIRLLTSTTTTTDGRPRLEDYVTVVPVKIKGTQVQACFLARWDVNIQRLGAEGKLVKAQPRPGDAGYRRFRNLKLTLDRDEPVFVRGGGLGPGEEVVIAVLTTGRGRAELSISGPPDQIVDLSQADCREDVAPLTGHREGNLLAILDRLNHGDLWDREYVL
jgi:hypothetical protein